VANTWEQKSVTLLINNATGAFAKDNSQGLFIGFGLAAKSGGSRETSTLNQWVPAGTAYVASTANRTDFASTVGATIKIAQVKLSIGSQVVDFSLAANNLAEELKLCQRYFEKTYDTDVSPGTITTSGKFNHMNYAPMSNVGEFCYCQFKFIKRASPQITIYNPALSNTTGSLRVGGSNNLCSASSVDQNGFTVNYLSGGVAAVAYSLLTWHFTADAEL
jgi:hypothetical protein